MTDEERRFHRQDQKKLGQIQTAIGALVFSILTFGGGVVWWASDMTARLIALEEDRQITRENTAAVRDLEMSGAAIGEKLTGIESSVRRTERMLEQLLKEDRQK